MAVLASFNTTMHMISRALFGLELPSQPAIIGHYDRSFFLSVPPAVIACQLGTCRKQRKARQDGCLLHV